MSTSARQLLPATDVKTITVDDSLVLVDENSGHYFGLNEVGAMIWRLLEEGRDEADIVDTIVNEYDTEEKAFAGDLQRILNELADAGLVQ